MGQIKKFLGIQLEESTNGDIKLHQTQYIQMISKRFAITAEEPVSTPLPVGIQLSKRDCPVTEDDKQRMKGIKYRSLIGCLLYVAQRTRPDIIHAVAALSQFNCNPSFTHWTILRQVLRYVVATQEL